MAKRIDFIAPFEGLRGNVSGRQDLVYALNDNKAFEAPQGMRNYARNYKPRYVSAKRASDGRMYFSVRTKNGVHITSKSLQAMALLGGLGAIYAAIVADKTTGSLYDRLNTMWIATTEIGNPQTFRQWLTAYLRNMLSAKISSVTVAGPGGSVQINNPWVPGATGGDNVAISQQVLVKFWLQLTRGGIYFYVDSRKGIAYSGDLWEDITSYNVLGLVESDPIGGNTYVQVGSKSGPYLKDAEGNYPTWSSEITVNGRYTTTDAIPA